LLTNVTTTGAAATWPFAGGAMAVMGNTGKSQFGFPNHPPLFFTPALTANFTSVKYGVNCTNGDGVTAFSENGTFNINLAGFSQFTIPQGGVMYGGENFMFSGGPPTSIGKDEFDNASLASGSPDTTNYNPNLDIREVLIREGPFITLTMNLKGSRFNVLGDLMFNTTFSTETPESLVRGAWYNGTGVTPACTGSNANRSTTASTSYSNGDAQYYWFVDVDGNPNSGCSLNASEANSTANAAINKTPIHNGFDMFFELNASDSTAPVTIYTCNATASLKLIKNLNNNNFNLSNVKVLSNVSATFIKNEPFGCDDGNAGIKFSAMDMALSTGTASPNSTGTGGMRVFAQTRNASGWQDSAHKVFKYVPGTADFIPFDPSNCNTSAYNSSHPECTFFGVGTPMMGAGMGFFNATYFEDCFNNRDDDNDGLSDLNDPDCSFMPSFTGTDENAPVTLFSKSDAFSNGAMIVWNTNEPSKGNVSFYNTNSTCANAVNKSVADDPVKAEKFDDFKPFHNVMLTSLNPDFARTLTAGNTYYYKIISMDKNNNTATSNCLSFTTVSGSGFTDNRIVTFSPPPWMSNFKVDSGSGTFTSYTPGQNTIAGGTDFKMRFESPGGDWKIDLGGVDLTGNSSVDLAAAFLNGSTGAGGKPFIGINKTIWLEIAQKLQADYVDLEITDVGDTLYKCSDNGSDCSDVTNQVTLLSKGSGKSKWRIPTSLGFSVYNVTKNGVTIEADRTTYECSPVKNRAGGNTSCVVYINVTNANATLGNNQLLNVSINVSFATGGLAAQGHAVSIEWLNRTVANTPGGSSTADVWLKGMTRAASAVQNASAFNTTMGDSSTGLNFSNYGTNSSSTHRFRLNITLNTTDSLDAAKFNFTITFNETGPESVMAVILAGTNLNIMNLSSPIEGAITNDTTPDFTFLYRTEGGDYSQNCSLYIDGVWNATNGTVVNATATNFTANTSGLPGGRHTWFVACTDDTNSENMFSETRSFVVDTTAP
ncbi:MAG: hypothetical protein HY518_00270, partial [Candidatus Aenigmarchaeota archaeon]|nr:hypothetical protein [Candidatus Aenigmarchaeota archaeon]